MIELLIIQGARSSFFRKKLAKANMSSIFAGFGKTRKLKKFVLKINN